jgi:uncharacterized protein (TIGR03083 family)
VQDNLSHLIGVERMLQGLPPTAHQAAGVDHVKNAIGVANENEIDARRDHSGAAVLSEWNELVELRLRTLRDAGEDYFAQPAATPTGPGTMADFLHIRVLDCWAHEQDMRRALDRPGNLDSPSAEHTIDRLLRTIPIVVGKRAGTPEGATVVIELTGPVKRTVPVTVLGGRATVVDSVPPDVLATVSMDSETFGVLALGRRTAAEVSDGWEITGDTTIGEAVVSQLGMMI